MKTTDHVVAKEATEKSIDLENPHSDDVPTIKEVPATTEDSIDLESPYSDGIQRVKEVPATYNVEQLVDISEEGSHNNFVDLRNDYQGVIDYDINDEHDNVEQLIDISEERSQNNSVE